MATPTPTTVPPTHRAAVVTIPGKHLAIQDVPVPRPRPDQVLVKVSHAAQNPADVKALDASLLPAGHGLGADFAGTVVAVGSAVTRLAEGYQVAGFLSFGEMWAGAGAFAEYTLADSKIAFQIPPSVSPAGAATVPLAGLTAWQALFASNSLGIDRAKAAQMEVLIWGGSSSVGLFAIQLAAHFRFKRIFTTCRPHNFALVTSLGAHAAFDYRDQGVTEKIWAAVPGLQYVFDTIGAGGSSAVASRAMRDQGGVLCTVTQTAFQPTEGVRDGVELRDVFVYGGLGGEMRLGPMVYPHSQEIHDLSVEFFEKIGGWMEEGKVKQNPTKVYSGRLEDVEKGLQEYREGKVSGYKIVYEL